jgi:hypothetical protein
MAFAGLWDGFKWPKALLRPAGDDVLKVWPIRKQVNYPRNNG